jgi:hypothetical protein
LNGLGCACRLPFLHNFAELLPLGRSGMPAFADETRPSSAAQHTLGSCGGIPAFVGLFQLSIASENRTGADRVACAPLFKKRGAIIMTGDDDLGIDTSSLTDADWVEIDKLKHALQADGDEGLQKALEQLLRHDPASAARILGAFFSPRRIDEVLADELAEHGLTVEDFREMILKLGRSPTKH